MVPIAAFLAGALLSLLLPVALLTALSVWYWVFSARVPAAAGERGSGTDPGAPSPASNPGPTIQQPLPPEPEA